jgi:hypothetical protein
MVPRTDHQMVTRDCGGGRLSNVVAIVMERPRLVIVVIAGDRQDGKVHARVAVDRWFSCKIECGVAHVIQPHIHHRYSLSVLIEHPPVIRRDADGTIEFTERPVRGVLFQYFALDIFLIADIADVERAPHAEATGLLFATGSYRRRNLRT